MPEAMLQLITTVVLCIFVGERVSGFPSGMPNTPDICLSMTPGHRPNTPQTHPPPFDIIVSRDRYRASDYIDVTIRMRGNEKFKGFAIQARRIGENVDRDVPVGFFRSIPGTQEVCNQPKDIRSPVIGNGLTHTNDSSGSLSPKSSLTLTWNPSGSHGHIEFRVTVVVNFNKYWVAEPSAAVRDVMSRDQSLPVSTTLAPKRVSKSITVNECGKLKGCYRNPPNCNSATCDILVTWKADDNDENIYFEMVGDTEGWVAIGLSDDLKMGNDDVFECVANRSSVNKKRPVVAHSRNVATGKSNYVVAQSSVIDSPDGIIDNGRLNCYFRVPKKGHGSLATNRYHLLMAKGRADEKGNKLPHVLEPNKYPYVSVNKVSLVDNSVDITSTTRYVLVKVHGVLMLIGWMMCASTALILAKYYKPMWPNDRLCGERVWFAVHRGCMAINLFATIIGFIIIFIHAGGYSQMPDLPAKAHPILGIITTILCIMNPLIALCKCSDKSDKRPIFNWIHWFIGTCATVLATPTMFIGLNLPKAHVPWWATWVMVSFFLFHLIIELLLEIHGCLNASKQKYRTQEYEMRKPRDDREQEPVGKRFKKIVLCIYVVVVICLGLVMVISVIAG